MNAKDTNAHYVIKLKESLVYDALNQVLCTHINGKRFIGSATT